MHRELLWRETSTQPGDQITVEFDGMHVRQLREELLRQRRQSWADLDDLIVGPQGHRGNDGTQNPLINQKMLTKALAGLVSAAVISQAAVRRRSCHEVDAAIPAPVLRSCARESRSAQRSVRGQPPNHCVAH